jgi:hypothetical protein
VTTPLFLNLSEAQYVPIAGPAFVSGLNGRSQEMAVFRISVPVALGDSLLLVVDTCDDATTVGTLVSVHDECPDPWRAAREANYLIATSITDVVDGSRAFNDDDPTCLTGALTTTTSGGVPFSRASRVEVHVDSNTPTAFILVQRDASTDVVAGGASGAVGWGGIIKLSVKCAIDTPAPTAQPSLPPTPAPSFPFITRLAFNVTLRLEFARASDFFPTAAAAVAAAATGTNHNHEHFHDDDNDPNGSNTTHHHHHDASTINNNEDNALLAVQALVEAMAETLGDGFLDHHQGVVVKGARDLVQEVDPCVPLLSSSSSDDASGASSGVGGGGGGGRRRSLKMGREEESSPKTNDIAESHRRSSRKTTDTTVAVVSSISCGETLLATNAGLLSFQGNPSGDASFLIQGKKKYAHRRGPLPSTTFVLFTLTFVFHFKHTHTPL